MKKTFLSDLVKILVLSLVLLILSSFYYNYNHFYVFALFTLYLLILGAYFKKYLKVITGFTVVFILFFLIYNINYLFVLGICIVLGTFIYNMINPELNINKWFYSLLALFLLFHILWFNILPFGYDIEYTYDLNKDQISKYITLEGFNEQECENNLCSRKLNQTIGYIVFKPEVIMKNVSLNVEINSDNLSIINPILNLDFKNNTWDYVFDFTYNIPNSLIITYKNQSLEKKPSISSCGLNFDSNTRLILPESQDKFENESFLIYVEWTPYSNDNGQQIIGHYNWEFDQYQDKLHFRVGRMDNISGEFYSINYNINDSFYNNTHSAILIYNPLKNGYIEMYIDNQFADRIYFGDKKIFKNYGTEPLSLGWSSHNYNSLPYFNGCISKIFYGSDLSQLNTENNTKVTFKLSTLDEVKIPVINSGSKLNSVTILKNE